MSYKSTEKQNTMAANQGNSLSRKELLCNCYSLEESKRMLMEKVHRLMRTKYILLLLFTSIITQSAAQITTLGESTKEKALEETNKEIPIYDSLSNFIKINGNYKHLIGQRAYCFKLPSRFSSLEKSYLKEEFEQRVEGKYFFIIEDDNEIGIALRIEDDEEIFYLSSASTPNHYFIIEGYFEKAKSLYVGKELVFITDDRDSYKFNGLFNLETKTRDNQITKNTIWKCTGLSVDEDAYMHVEEQSPVVLLLNNEMYGDYYCYLQSDDMVRNFDSKDYILGKFLYREDYAKKQKNDAIAAKQKKDKEQQRIQALVAKYGQSNVDLARQGRVKIGWNKELCKVAWGEPKSINKTTTAYGVHEQWVYSTSRYLYFDDGVLTAIQE